MDIVELLWKTASISDLRCKHCAILLSKQMKIISMGYNHFIQQNVSRHAEISCLSKIKDIKQIRDSTLIVCRQNKNCCNKFLFSKPCHRCEQYISSFAKHGLKRILYTVNSDDSPCLQALQSCNVPKYITQHFGIKP